MTFERVHPFGDLTSEGNSSPATTPVPLPVIFCRINGELTAIDRKLWLLLLHVSWGELLTKSQVGVWHEIEESDLSKLFERYSGNKDIARLWDSARRLAKTTVEYVRTDGDERWEGISSLFHAEYKSKAKRDGRLRYMFPAPLIPIILEPGRFARLRVQCLLGLHSKYAVSLYQVLESVANMREPVLEATVQEMRDWLKVPEGKLKDWGDFWRFAIKPSLDEINENFEISGIQITSELKRCGRGGKVGGVRFTVRKTLCRLTFEKTIRIDQRSKEKANITKFIPPFRGTTIYEKAKKKGSTELSGEDVDIKIPKTLARQ